MSLFFIYNFYFENLIYKWIEQYIYIYIYIYIF